MDRLIVLPHLQTLGRERKVVDRSQRSGAIEGRKYLNFLNGVKNIAFEA